MDQGSFQSKILSLSRSSNLLPTHTLLMRPKHKMDVWRWQKEASGGTKTLNTSFIHLNSLSFQNHLYSLAWRVTPTFLLHNFLTLFESNEGMSGESDTLERLTDMKLATIAWFGGLGMAIVTHLTLNPL